MNGPLNKFGAQGVVNRRDVVVGAALVGGALVVGCSPADIMSAGSKVEVGAFGPFIKVAADGAVTVISKHVEFGQGNHAGLAAIVAEELDADWTRVMVEQAPANAKLYANGTAGAQMTGGSSAISGSWDQLRKAGAATRAMFVQAAAAKWSVPAGEIAVKDSVLSHTSGKTAGFGELIADAAKITPIANPPLKDPKTFTLIGTDRVRRKDSQAKSDGTARFTQDVRLPDMLTAMVAHAPRFGGKLKSFDAAEAKKVPGVFDVFEIPTGVAVVAQSTYAARMGREALKLEWNEDKAEKRSSSAIAASFRDIAAGKGPADLKWEGFDSKGDAAVIASAKGAKVFEATYEFPYLAHATMEPMNCVAAVDGSKVKLTFGSQGQTLDQLNAAKIVGTLPGSVEIETLFAGGSFGRRATFQSDYAAECVHIAKKIGKGRPVKLVWTREDDMRAGYFRPLVVHAVKISLDKDGYPAAWRHRIVSQSIMKGSPMGGKGPDQSAIEGTAGSPYLKATPIVDAQLALPEVGVPVLWWRSVGATHTAFVMEHTIDQLARKAGKDPVDYRRALYAKVGADRHLAALNLAMEKAGPAPTAGWSRGVAVHESFGSVVAQVAEVQLVDGQPKVGRVVTAIDCGVAISPNQIAAQTEGGTCYGLSAALFGEVTLTEGVVDQTNFDGYRVLRMNEAPTVETYIVPSGSAPSGVGEPGTPVIAPAVANALLALTSKSTARLPFTATA
ncbi:molybdopterin cofactor-binding domain-containing protein [Caulobacter sp. ErkDOM-YI]|uniref:xanthine dehydrogenase family protein molybdopterin-binding subunit n=1 Tax=unclassified Caulobacter TaxID=2648921 RepID=UPI003AF73A8C